MAGIMDYLEGRIRTLHKKLMDLEAERDRIEEEIEGVVELLRSTEAVLEAERKARGLSDREEVSRAAVKSKIRTMTLKDAIYTVVKSKGKQGIHVNDIFESLKDAGFAFKSQTPKKSIVGTIYHGINKRGTYEKVAPNTFRVVETEGGAVQAELVGVKES